MGTEQKIKSKILITRSRRDEALEARKITAFLNYEYDLKDLRKLYRFLRTAPELNLN